jgi:CubicO group peptidase (beta-lactamase class C family)
MSARLEVDGTVAAGFEPVRQVFLENLRRRGEWGGAFCAWHEGRVVVDLWGGHADRRRGEPWRADTLATVFSATKGLVALAFLMLEGRGALDLDRPVAAVWPEFARGGKGTVTVPPGCSRSTPRSRST